jgi:ketosteroid isomerase-like protein
MITARPTLTLALLLAVALAACQPAGHGSADTAALDKAAAGWEAAFNDKNADAVAAIYTDDGQLLPPNAATVNGRAAIKDYWANDIATQWAKISIKADSSVIAGDWAYRSGAWSTESPALSGKFVEVWKRTGDGWQLHKDIWNMDAMAEAPPAPDAAPTPEPTPVPPQ